MGTPGRCLRGPPGPVALAGASGVGSAAVSTVAGAGEDSGVAASAAVGSGEVTATAARRATRRPGQDSAAGRPTAIEVTVATVATEATGATGASAVGMTLVVLGAHLMTDLAAATVTGARGTRARPAATWSPSGPGSPGRMVGIATETTAVPVTTDRGMTGRGMRGPGTTTGRGTTTAAAGTTSLGRSAATNQPVLRWVSARARAISGHWWYHSFLSPSSPRVSKSKSVTGFSLRQLYLLRQGRVSFRPFCDGLSARHPRSVQHPTRQKQYNKPRGRLERRWAGGSRHR